MDNLHASETRGDGRWKWALAGFLAVAAFLLWTEHRAHLLGVLPFLLVLACPLMHLFHHGHGHASHRQAQQPPEHGSEQPRTGAPP